MRLALFTLVGLLLVFVNPAGSATPDDEQVIASFLELLTGDTNSASEALQLIDDEWHPGFVTMSLETLSLSGTPAINDALIAIVESNTGQSHGFDLSAWYEWLWNRPETAHPAYADFKSALYALIDPAFAGYFGADRVTAIRLDEIRWGGVRQDGIPPLRNPRMVAASEAGYLADDNIVFGLEVNGDARAYPKRILAWHELFVDRVGDLPVAGVYCTLCGTMILYVAEHGGTHHELGTSGFLYRSNKLMYDQATQSLWSTLWGRPVVGPLTDQDIELERRSVVTTTWGAWRERHPNTLVLSLDTGYRRDYSEGAAYRDYFATDELMFTVPTLDRRLDNKDEVLGLLAAGSATAALAIASDFLLENTVHHDVVGDREVVVFTDESGAHRVYETHGTRFAQWDGLASVLDTEGTSWTLDEARLKSADGRSLDRFPAHGAFWFGWYSAFPETRLVR